MNHGISTIILMGVSGSGKTTIGKLLAERFGWFFIESDEYHTADDIHKMSSGIPLTDQDRWPWLYRLNKLLKDAQDGSKPVVLACSALKQEYRDILSDGLSNFFYVYLRGDYELIFSRMQQRHHFMGAHMLASQFEILEAPADALVIDIKLPPHQIVDTILAKLFN